MRSGSKSGVGVHPRQLSAGGSIGCRPAQQTNRDVLQRVATAEKIGDDRYQSWLRHMNAQRYEVYVSMNTLRPGAHGRTKADVRDIRHVYLDLDEGGEAK